MGLAGRGEGSRDPIGRDGGTIDRAMQWSPSNPDFVFRGAGGPSPAAQMGCLRNRSRSPSGADQP